MCAIVYVPIQSGLGVSIEGILNGLYRDHTGSLLKGYEAVFKES